VTRIRLCLCRLRAALIALAAVLPVATPTEAGTYGALPPEKVAQVEVLPGWTEGGLRIAAISIALAPGWKTYWRAPGDAGIPPSFDWKGSGNLAGLQFHWPVPHVFATNGMRSVGYKDRVVLPILLTPTRSGEPIRLRGALDLGVCLDICMPVTVAIDATIPPGGAHDPRIAAALADRALTGAEAGVLSAICTVEPIRDGLRLTARLTLPRQGGPETVVIETDNPRVWVSDTESVRSGGMLEAQADLVPSDARPFTLDRSALRITVLGEGRAVDIRGCTGG
jgi:hypothetical protein